MKISVTFNPRAWVFGVWWEAMAGPPWGRTVNGVDVTVRFTVVCLHLPMVCVRLETRGNRHRDGLPCWGQKVWMD